MRIQYISDIHLEHYKIYTEQQLNPTQWIVSDPSAELLVLAGDIGNPNLTSYNLFLAWCSKNWPQVVLLAGNHEFYRHTADTKGNLNVNETIQLIRAITSYYPNIHFLDRNTYEVSPGYSILGCTLWSDIPTDMKKYAERGIADFRFIEGMSVDTYNDYHKRDLDWLKNELQATKAKKVIVVTHHMPSHKLIAEKYKDCALNCCFASNLDSLLEECAPTAWICGHSHTGNRVEIQTQNGNATTILTLNPHGYPGEGVRTRRQQVILDI